MLQLKTFVLLSLIIFIVVIGFNYNGVITVFSQNDKDPQSSKNNNNDNREGLTTIKVKMIKNNLDLNNHDRLKIVGYLNGEGQIKYVDVNELDKNGENGKKIFTTEVTNSKNKPLFVDLKFNKSNDISSVMVDDEYYVCAYVMDNNKREIPYNNNDSLTFDPNNDSFPIYDCDEGNIGLSTSKDTVTLFATMKKYDESKAKYNSSKTFYSTKQKTQELNDADNPEKVKITIDIPIFDAKNVNDMKVVSMIKGEYKIKTIDVQKSFKNGDVQDGRIPVPFTFERQTEVGLIQPGDLFFGCVTSDEFTDQNSDCEKRMLKDLDTISWVCARKDSSC